MPLDKIASSLLCSVPIVTTYWKSEAPTELEVGNTNDIVEGVFGGRSVKFTAFGTDCRGRKLSTRHLALLQEGNSMVLKIGLLCAILCSAKWE